MDWTDELEAYVRGLIDDLIFDHIQDGRSAPLEIKTTELRVIDCGTDDGCAYGTYEISVNGGQYLIRLEASGAFAGEQDCWDWGRDSHYTKTVTFDELQDCEYNVIKVIDGEKEVGKVGDSELNLREDK